MSHFPRSHANEARFSEGPLSRTDDSANVAAQAAVTRFWERLTACNTEINTLDGWAGNHDRTACCGEARPETAAGIDGITADMQVIEMLLVTLVAKARGIER